MTITTEYVLDLIKQGEGISLELKECNNSLPKSIWETYSAFANTRGGVIMLGISEDTNAPLESRFRIQGVQDAYKLRTDFFNILNNRQKVSRSVLVDSDVRTIEVNGKNVIYINVPEADYHKKPIYINNDLQNGTYKRTHEGDRHVDMEGLAMLIRDAADDIDSQIVEHYGMQDIDADTLSKYRQEFNDSNPGHSYRTLSNKDFLIRMGGYAIDRHNEKEGLTRAGLLMFGKGQSIHEVFQTFRMDYINLIGITKGDSRKWNDRLTDDGRWEDNLYLLVELN